MEERGLSFLYLYFFFQKKWVNQVLNTWLTAINLRIDSFEFLSLCTTFLNYSLSLIFLYLERMKEFTKFAKEINNRRKLSLIKK